MRVSVCVAWLLRVEAEPGRQPVGLVAEQGRHGDAGWDIALVASAGVRHHPGPGRMELRHDRHHLVDQLYRGRFRELEPLGRVR